MKIAAFDVGYRNMGMCIFQHSKVHKLALFDVVESKHVPPFVDIARKLNTLLDSLKHELVDCDVVLIERQIKFNFKASRLSVHMMSWMTIHLPARVNIVEYHAKFKTFGAQLKTTKERKNYTTEFALNWLSKQHDHGDHLAHFRALPKKDDVADALCMIVAYLFNSNT